MILATIGWMIPYKCTHTTLVTLVDQILKGYRVQLTLITNALTKAAGILNL